MRIRPENPAFENRQVENRTRLEILVGKNEPMGTQDRHDFPVKAQSRPRLHVGATSGGKRFPIEEAQRLQQGLLALLRCYRLVCAHPVFQGCCRRACPSQDLVR